MPLHRLSSTNRRTQGSTLVAVIIVLMILAVAVLLARFFLNRTGKVLQDAPLLAEVIRGPYEHVVLEQGEVESTKNVEIRCEVKARGGGGSSTTILDVIPEGTMVEAGDWLVTLDSSSLEEDLSRQRIVVNTSEALMIQAEAIYETSKIAEKEYLLGTFVQEEKMSLNEIYVAEDALKKAELELKSSERLLAKGLITDLQVEAQRFSLAKADNELDAGRTKLRVLRDYTLKKMLTQLSSDIKAADVKWRNEKDSHAEEVNKLGEIRSQLEKCTIRAPNEGVVVYANVQSGRSNEFIVEPGSPVRERQVIIRLPDPKKMQIKAKINEASINLVHAGQRATIRIEALGDVELPGQVVKVSQYAEPGHWWRSNSKEYATQITIVDPPDNILSGLTAEVRIHVEQEREALQLPIQAVYESSGRTFCLIQNDGQLNTIEITILSSNEKTVVIDETSSELLRPGDKVVANARRHATSFVFPEGDTSMAADSQNEKELSHRPRVAEKKEAAGDKAKSSQGIISHLDRDQDGVISQSEIGALPEQFRQRFSRADKNGDGNIDQTELSAAMASFKRQ